jgi:putative transposase
MDTRAGSIGLAIPKLRHGSYFPDWLLERRRRAEAALVTVVAMSHLLGVSTRRMEKLVQTLGITRLSKSQVSEMARDLDAQVEAFRTRPLDAGPYTFVAADALVLKVRENVAAVFAGAARGMDRDAPLHRPRRARPQPRHHHSRHQLTRGSPAQRDNRLKPQQRIRRRHRHAPLRQS